jgi:hypothetical protein
MNVVLLSISRYMALHDLGFCLDVDRARRLVGGQDRGILEERTREADALTLAARQAQAALSGDIQS